MCSEVSYLHLITEIRNLSTHVNGIVVSFPKPKGLGIPLSKVGFPIRKSTDQSFFAAPHGLSQRSTSFIASQRQGIHRTPLRHLITLIINIHPLGVNGYRFFGQSFSLRPDCSRNQAATERPALLLGTGPTAEPRGSTDECVAKRFAFGICILRRHVFTTAGMSDCSSYAANACTHMMAHHMIAHAMPLIMHDRHDPLFTMSDNRPRIAFTCRCATRRLFMDELSSAGFQSKRPAWWSQSGSNRRPHACKARALPAELWPRARTPKT
jgi:hypothetical protein